MTSIARIYADRCEREENPVNFFTVPKELQKEVEEILISDGYTIEKDGSVVKR